MDKSLTTIKLEENSRILAQQLEQLNPVERQQFLRPLCDTVTLILNASNIARKDGLLALEDYANTLKDNGIDNLYYLLLLIIDGTDPQLVEEIGWMRFATRKKGGMDAIKMILELIGVLSIQNGENPRIIEEKLFSILSDETRFLYNEIYASRDQKEAGKVALNNLSDIPVMEDAVGERPEIDSEDAIGEEPIDDAEMDVLTQEAEVEELAPAIKPFQPEVIKPCGTKQEVKWTPYQPEELKNWAQNHPDQNVPEEIPAQADYPCGCCDVIGQRIRNGVADGPLMVLSTVSCLLRRLDNRSVQRFLRDVDNATLAVALRGLDQDACEIIFLNMSTRLSDMIKQDMRYMGSIRLAEVSEAAERLVDVLTSLGITGEITDIADSTCFEIVSDIMKRERNYRQQMSEKEVSYGK